MDSIAPEAALLRACARLRLAEGDRGRIDAALREPLDWALVMRLAAWHGLRPLLERHLAQADPALVPREARVELWAEVERIRRRNEALASELASLDAAFESAGVRAVHYKGPTLALAAYGDLALREFGDLDILMDRNDIPAAQRLLRGRGFVPVNDLPPAVEAAVLESSAQYHVGLRSAAGRVVELHWRTDAGCVVEATGRNAWWGATDALSVAGRVVRCLRPEELTLVLCIHGAKHHWTCLGWVVDVTERLRAAACGDWPAIEARARQLGCSRRVGLALALARDVLDAPMPSGATALAALPNVERISRQFAANLLSAAPREPASWEALRLDLALQERTADRVRLVADTVCRPTMAEWTRWPLPRGLAFLYPTLRLGRLAAKYARRGLGALLRRGKLQT